MARGVRSCDIGGTWRVLTNCVLKFWLTPKWTHFIHARVVSFLLIHIKLITISIGNRTQFVNSLSMFSIFILNQTRESIIYVFVYLCDRCNVGRWHKITTQMMKYKVGWARILVRVRPDIAWLWGLRCTEDAATLLGRVIHWPNLVRPRQA